MGERLRFYLDQHVAAMVARGLRERGVDVLTAAEAGRCGVTDAEQLGFATADERVMVTFDTDYLALAARGVAHAGLAYCHPTKYSASQMLHVMLSLHAVMDTDNMRNHVEYL